MLVRNSAYPIESEDFADRGEGVPERAWIPIMGIPKLSSGIARVALRSEPGSLLSRKTSDGDGARSADKSNCVSALEPASQVRREPTKILPNNAPRAALRWTRLKRHRPRSTASIRRPRDGNGGAIPGRAASRVSRTAARDCARDAG